MFSALFAQVKLLFASTYGSGAYGSNPYGGVLASGTNVQVGPITLPVTGAGLMIIVGALALAVAAGWLVWLRQQRKKSPVSTPAD